MNQTSQPPLALHGGPPTLPVGPPAWPVPDEAIQAALQAAYADGSWGRYEGANGRLLAARLAEIHEVAHVLPCSSGTFAVELALRALKVRADDEVILAGYDFSGNFRGIEALGARPVLVDIHPDTWCLDEQRVQQAIGPSTRALVVSHLHGGLASMPALCELAARHGLVVVEDACQAPGAVVAGRPAGSWGDVGVLSFGGSKLLTAGRGGAMLTRHADVHQRAKVYCERGNHAFPLSELQAAVLRPQLEKLADRNQRRLENVRRLLEAANDLPALQPLRPAARDCRPSYYKLAWRYEATACGGHSREQFLAAIQAEGVALDAGFRGFGRRSQRRCRHGSPLSHSEQAANNTVILHHPVLLEPAETIELVAAALRKVVGALSAS